MIPVSLGVSSRLEELLVRMEQKLSILSAWYLFIRSFSRWYLAERFSLETRKTHVLMGLL